MKKLVKGLYIKIKFMQTNVTATRSQERGFRETEGSMHKFTEKIFVPFPGNTYKILAPDVVQIKKVNLCVGENKTVYI